MWHGKSVTFVYTLCVKKCPCFSSQKVAIVGIVILVEDRWTKAENTTDVGENIIGSIKPTLLPSSFP